MQIVWQILVLTVAMNLSLKSNTLPVLALSAAPPTTSTLALVGHGGHNGVFQPLYYEWVLSAGSRWWAKKVLRLSEYLDNKTKSHHIALCPPFSTKASIEAVGGAADRARTGRLFDFENRIIFYLYVIALINITLLTTKHLYTP